MSFLTSKQHKQKLNWQARVPKKKFKEKDLFKNI